uniref:Uncharacterized protein n=1 Tax=Nelumbo nucifera TaxID=4432 RepID=A0A822XD26_NELNU|nr:TPA_asm: hypothetical protein HUJ06_019683 [Nelumbo nucifera]
MLIRISPVNLFVNNTSSSNLLKDPNSLGILPSSWFFCKSNSFKELQVPISSGITLDKEFSLR